MQTGLYATISGRVQMVMFRDFVRRKALGLRLVGEVENLSDGGVKVYAEGEEETIMKFVEFLKRGSALSRVDNVAYQLGHPQGGYTTFSIRYT